MAETDNTDRIDRTFFYPKKVDSIPKTIDIQIATFAISASAFLYLFGTIIGHLTNQLTFKR
jgi:hypothetical protein